MDNLGTGTTDNLAHLAGHPRFSFIHHDVTNYIFVERGLACALHFAYPASPLDYLRHPIQSLKMGALGTRKGLGLAKSKKAGFLLASTLEVYGDPLSHPQSEAYWGHVNPIGPRGAYDEAKRFGETITVASTLALPGFSTPTGRACVWKMGASFPTSSAKPCAGKI
jgi:dTDP-glucose 4,6-dehydratase